jgi:serine phosphatase RsbU (regulator of sigma subunit)
MLPTKRSFLSVFTYVRQLLRKANGQDSAAQMGGSFLLAGIILCMLAIAGLCLANAITCVGRPFAGFLFYDYRIVGSFGDYQWPGLRAGVHYQDVILQVEGRPISSGREILQIVAHAQEGEKLTYLLSRGGKQITLQVPVARFTQADFVKIFLLPFLEGLIFWVIGIVAYILKRNTATTWVFLLFCFFLGTYFVTGFALQSVVGLPGSSVLNILGLCFFPAAGLHLSFLFPVSVAWIEQRPLWLVLPYGASAFLFVSLLLDIGALINPSLATTTILSIATHQLMAIHASRFYTLLTAVALVVSSTYIYRTSPSYIARQRSRIVLLGAGAAFIPGTIVMAFVSYGMLVIPFNFFMLPVFIFPAAIGYAIARHNLFDVDVYVKRALGYAMMTAIVATAYVLTQTLVRTLLLNPLFGTSAEQAYPVLFAVLVVFFFNPVNRRVQEGVERIFFRKQSDYKETVSAVSQALTSVLNFEHILGQIVHTVHKEMFIETAGVVVLEPQKVRCRTFFVGDGSASAEDEPKEVVVAYDDPLVTLIVSEKQLVTKYDLEESPRYRAIRDVCVPRFVALAANMLIPLVYQEHVSGMLVLGYKKSGRFYTREDIDLLLTMANQAALALENAKLFQEHLEKTRLDEELKIAHTIQMSMLPTTAPAVAGFQIAARSLPARQVGGDFYDFLEIQNNGREQELGIVVGDVSGKAMSAALLMAASRSVLRVLSESYSSVEEVMTRGNQRLKKDIKKGMFVALLYAVVDPVRKTLTLSSAGQTQPILCRGDGSTPVYIETPGDKFPLGIVANSHYQETCLPLHHHDTVVLYTDGIVEAMNEQREMYGFERLTAAIEKGRDLTASSLLESLLTEVSDFVGQAEQHDDLTVVVLKVD